MNVQDDSMARRTGKKENGETGSDNGPIVSTDVSEESSDDEITFEESSSDEVIFDKKVTTEDLFNEMLDECILEISFECHRAARLGYIDNVVSKHCINNRTDAIRVTDSTCPYVGRSVRENSFQRNEDYVKGKKKYKEPTLKCPNRGCPSEISAKQYAKHFSACIYGEGRSKKKVNYNESTMFSTMADDSDEDAAPRSSRGKKSSTSQGKQKNNPRTPAYTYQSLQEMSLDDRSAFFSQYCGVKLKSSKYDSLCIRPKDDCNKHKDTERLCIRSISLSIAENPY